MPLYEYECTQCKRRTEKIQKFSDPELSRCPFCGGALERLVFAPAISFKGGGWYADGYGNATRNASANEGSREASSSSGDAPGGEPSSSSAKDSASPAPATSSPAPAATSNTK